MMNGNIFLLEVGEQVRFRVELLRQLLGTEMRIPLQHSEIFVPRNTRDLHDIQSAFKKTSRRFVAQIVKM